MNDLIKELIEATEEWHSVEDCKVEGRVDCRLCKAIEAAQHSVQADEGYAPLKDYDPAADIERISKEGFPKSLRR